MIQRARDDCRARKYRNRMSIMQSYFMDGHIKFKVGDCTASPGTEFMGISANIKSSKT